MKNKGFIATSLIYSFFLVFLALLAVILSSYVFNDKLLSTFNKSILNRMNREIDSTSDSPSYVQDVLDILHITPNATKPNFNNLAISDEGVFIADDNFGPSYYYRGDVTDNYVVFGNWKTDGGRPLPMYWRIIRVNGDGSLRLIYEGYKQRDELNKDPISTVAWSTNNTSTGYYNAFSGKLNEFYANKILGTKYEAAISDSGFCSTKSSTVTNASNCTKKEDKIICNNEEKSIDDFSDYDKIVTFAPSPVGISPSLSCTKDNLYSVSSTEGNGLLRYPIGLISSNEIVMAGGKYTTQENTASENFSNIDFYLFKNYNYWTMSIYSKKTNNGGGTSLMSIKYLNNNNAAKPNNQDDSTLYAFGYSEDGNLVQNALDNATYGLYPVINLKEEYVSTFEGDGTISNPFIGKLDRGA